MRKVIVLMALLPIWLMAAPLGTGITYQGELVDAGIPASGDYDFEFEIFDAQTAGVSQAAVVATTLTVSEGIFETTLDFGDSPFVGDQVWLEVRVRESGAGAFTTLSPRQQLTAAPYALHAQFVGMDAVTGDEIVDGSIDGTDLVPGAVGATQIDATQVQRRVTPGCSAGQAIRSINQDGSVICEDDDVGDDDWVSLADGRIQSDAGVRIQPDPVATFPFTVRHDSSIPSPQVALTESQPNDFTRLSFYNDANINRYWTIAGIITEPQTLDRLNFFHLGTGDIMTLTSDDRVGIRQPTPLAPLSVGSNDQWNPSIGNGRGDFYIGNNNLGLSMGVALNGGGAGASRIWTNGGAEQLFIGSSTQGDVLAVRDGFVGVANTNPLVELDVDGDARIRNLGFTGSGTRDVRVNSDGDLVASAEPVRYFSIPPAAFITTANRDYTIFNGGIYGNAGTTGLWAPVHLPDGAVMTELRMWFIDAAGSANLRINLCQNTFGTNACGLLANQVTSGTVSGYRDIATTSIASTSVDNATRSYFIQIFPDTSWTGNSLLLVGGVRVAYQMP